MKSYKILDRKDFRLIIIVGIFIIIPFASLGQAISVPSSYDELKRISENNGIYFIDGIPQAVRNAEQKGIITRAADGTHWNEAGHQIAARVIKEYFEVNW